MVSRGIARLDEQILNYIIQNYEDLCRKHGLESEKSISALIRESYKVIGASTLKDSHRYFHFLNDVAEAIKFEPHDFDKIVHIAFESMRKIKFMQHGEETTLENLALIIDELNKNKMSLNREDKYTAGHSERVGIYSVQIAKVLGLENTYELYTLGYVHDIGKLLGDKQTLIKEGPLTISEREKMNMHPELGFRFLEITGQGVFSNEILGGVLCHHVRFDKGPKGYPNIGDMPIPLYARIAAVADSYDAMNKQRPYRKKLRIEKIASELFTNRGTQFDPEMVDAFLEIHPRLKTIYGEIKAGNISLC